jgi:hypothetical protein
MRLAVATRDEGMFQQRAIMVNVRFRMRRAPAVSGALRIPMRVLARMRRRFIRDQEWMLKRATLFCSASRRSFGQASSGVRVIIQSGPAGGFGDVLGRQG